MGTLNLHCTFFPLWFYLWTFKEIYCKKSLSNKSFRRQIRIKQLKSKVCEWMRNLRFLVFVAQILSLIFFEIVISSFEPPKRLLWTSLDQKCSKHFTYKASETQLPTSLRLCIIWHAPHPLRCSTSFQMLQMILDALGKALYHMMLHDFETV